MNHDDDDGDEFNSEYRCIVVFVPLLSKLVVIARICAIQNKWGLCQLIMMMMIRTMTMMTTRMMMMIKDVWTD